MKEKELANILWDYHRLNANLSAADYAIGFGSHDLNVPIRAAELYHDGLVKKIIFSGGYGRITKKIWNLPEAEKFKEIAITNGVPSEDIIVETLATNTGENIANIKRLLAPINYQLTSFLIVDKTYRERRTYATLKKQWPELNFLMAAPDKSFNDYLEYYKENDVSCHDFYSIMVGDLQRILRYPESGFQISQFVPQNVIAAYLELISLGYTSQLIPGSYLAN